ncbi:hypothetical protein [Desulfosporosinus fructosivorans]
MPTTTGPAYALWDSWFTCSKVNEAHFKKGYHFISGLKTNRIIYPQGIRTSLKDFATYIKKDDVRLVTVNRQSYWVYQYEGALIDLDNAVVLFTWHEDERHITAIRQFRSLTVLIYIFCVLGQVIVSFCPRVI